MKKAYKEYISDVKKFFPVKGKEERKFLKKLASDIEIFCEDENITNKKEIYKKFGTPHNVVNDFYSTEDIDVVIKKIRFSKYIKIFFAILAVIAILISAVYCMFWYEDHLMDLRQEMVGVETIIE